MKTKLFAVCSALIFGTSVLVAQSLPQGISYQAIARDASGNPLGNKNISVRFTIMAGTLPPYISQYSETHATTTNQFGLFTLKVGMGSPVTGTFSSIPWKNGNQQLQVEMDPNGGTAYTNLGMTQLLSVPYSLSSATSADGWSVNGNSGTDASVNYLGNKDSIDLVFRTNNIERMRVNDNGRISIGLPNPSYLFQVRNTKTTEQVPVCIEGSHATYTSLYINALNASSSPGIGFTSQGLLRGLIRVTSTGSQLFFNYGQSSFSTKVIMNDKGWIDLTQKGAKIVRSLNTDTANIVAVAYGNISPAGVINTAGSTNNFTAAKTATGNYEITWTGGLNTLWQKAAVSVTTTYGNARITSWSSTGGGAVLIVKIYDAAGTPIDDGFSFTVFKP